MGLYPPGDDALGEVPGVGLEGLHAPRLEHLDVVVVHRGGLREDLLAGHGGEELGFGDAPGPFLTQLGAVLAEVGHKLAKQRGS